VHNSLQYNFQLEKIHKLYFISPKKIKDSKIEVLHDRTKINLCNETKPDANLFSFSLAIFPFFLLTKLSYFCIKTTFFEFFWTIRSIFTIGILYYYCFYNILLLHIIYYWKLKLDMLCFVLIFFDLFLIRYGFVN